MSHFTPQPILFSVLYLRVLIRVVGYDQRITGQVWKYGLVDELTQRDESSKAYFQTRPVIR